MIMLQKELTVVCKDVFSNSIDLILLFNSSTSAITLSALLPWTADFSFSCSLSSSNLSFSPVERVKGESCIFFYITVLFTNTQTLKFKSTLPNCVSHCPQSYLHSQATNLETWKHTKQIEIHQSQITKLPWPFEYCHLAFELQSSHVFEKCSKLKKWKVILFCSALNKWSHIHVSTVFIPELHSKGTQGY